MTNVDTSTRVGLLTLPLSVNYGGILQMLALHDALKQEGFEPVLLDKRARFRTAREVILSWLGRIPMQDLRGARSATLAARKHRKYFEQRVDLRSRPVKSGRDIERELARLGLSSVVVGSDQVWRLRYQKDADELNYFLNFGDDALRRVAYGASFGHGHWDGSERTAEIRTCMSRFDAIAVREKSGQAICSEVFGRGDAAFVLDPTLLHDTAHYRAMLEPVEARPGVLVYVLDRQREARQLADAVAAQHGGLPVRVLSPSARDFTSIPQWLSEFANAEFVVTDSFHGTVFSILFEKPFLTLLNSHRGLDRFTSLFDTLGLHGRGLTDWSGGVPAAAEQPLDFAAISDALTALRGSSRAFLRQALSGGV